MLKGYNLIRSGLEGICGKLTSIQLSLLAVKIGSGIGIRKDDKVANILDQSKLLFDMNERMNEKGGLDITSIDIGVANFAFCQMRWSKGDGPPFLVGLEKFCLQKKFVGIVQGKQNMLSSVFTAEMCFQLTEFLTAKRDLPDIFTIEKQRTRSMSSKTVLDPVLRANILEQVLFSNLQNKLKWKPTLGNYKVVSSDPGRMTKYWCERKDSFPAQLLSNEQYLKLLGKKTKTLATKSNSKPTNLNKFSKFIKISIARDLIRKAVHANQSSLTSTPIVAVEPDIKKLFHNIPLDSNKDYNLYDSLQLTPEIAGARKDDDLADSFLHALAWMEWLRSYNQITALLPENPQNVTHLERDKFITHLNT